jgi:Nucleotidyltransferase of unknown function (DUF6036)
MTMHYGLSRSTSDLDILTAVPSDKIADLERTAGRGSKLQRKFRIYIQPVRITCYPESHESRLIEMWPELGLRHLRLLVLEPHDLVLTKLERNSDVDRQDVLQLSRGGHLDEATLRDRYEQEFRPNLTGSTEKHDLTLKLWIEMCWPGSGG